MAVKLAPLAVIYVAALSIVFEAHATVATVTTIEESSKNHHMDDGIMCRDQFCMANKLSHCQFIGMEMCMREECRGGRFSFEWRDTEYFHRGRFPGIGGVMGRDGSRHIRPCCQQRRMMDMKCRCQGLRETMWEHMMEMGRVSSWDKEEKFRNLHSMCGMETGRCDMGMMRPKAFRWELRGT